MDQVALLRLWSKGADTRHAACLKLPVGSGRRAAASLIIMQPQSQLQKEGETLAKFPQILVYIKSNPGAPTRAPVSRPTRFRTVRPPTRQRPTTGCKRFNSAGCQKMDSPARQAAGLTKVTPLFGPNEGARSGVTELAKSGVKNGSTFCKKCGSHFFQFRDPTFRSKKF